MEHGLNKKENVTVGLLSDELSGPTQDKAKNSKSPKKENTTEGPVGLLSEVSPRPVLEIKNGQSPFKKTKMG